MKIIYYVVNVLFCAGCICILSSSKPAPTPLLLCVVLLAELWIRLNQKANSKEDEKKKKFIVLPLHTEEM